MISLPGNWGAFRAKTKENVLADRVAFVRPEKVLRAGVPSNDPAFEVALEKRDGRAGLCWSRSRPCPGRSRGFQGRIRARQWPQPDRPEGAGHGSRSARAGKHCVPPGADILRGDLIGPHSNRGRIESFLRCQYPSCSR